MKRQSVWRLEQILFIVTYLLRGATLASSAFLNRAETPWLVALPKGLDRKIVFEGVHFVPRFAEKVKTVKKP